MSNEPTPPLDQLAAPIRPSERHEIIDIIRGFALFGVLLSNMLVTSQGIALTDEQRADLPTASVDAVSIFLADTLITSKFFTIFSMLFGLGFAMQMRRASERANPSLRPFARRLTLLLIFGVLDSILLWFGDVLHVYALLGFLLILFRNRSDRAILTVWAFLFAIMCSLSLLDSLAAAAGWEDSMAFGRDIPPEEIFQALRHGTYPDILSINWAIHLNDYGVIGIGGNMLWWYLDIFTKFLIGFLIGRRMLLQRSAELLPHFKRVLPYAMVIGILGSTFDILWYEHDFGRPQSQLAVDLLSGLYEIFVLTLAIAYACLLVVVYHHPRWGRFLRPLAPLGRMALSNYLTHSVCFILIFYGLGFGLLGRVGATACWGLSIAIIAAQITFSRWWLTRFRFGPAEWVWRCLTYGAIQPNRIKEPEAV